MNHVTNPTLLSIIGFVIIIEVICTHITERIKYHLGRVPWYDTCQDHQLITTVNIGVEELNGKELQLDIFKD